MTVFAGVFAESIIFGGDAWVNFRGQADDVSKLQEILDLKGTQDQTEADRWQLDAWKRSEQLVLRKRAQILRVAEALLKKRFLSGDEVRSFLLPQMRIVQCKTALLLSAVVLLIITHAILARLTEHAD